MPVKVFYFMSVGLQLYWNWTSSLIFLTDFDHTISLIHCVKSVHNRSYSDPHFPALGLNTERYSAFSRISTKYGEILLISPYSIRMRENADQNNSKYGHFLRSNTLQNSFFEEHSFSEAVQWKCFAKKGSLEFPQNLQENSSLFLNRAAALSLQLY